MEASNPIGHGTLTGAGAGQASSVAPFIRPSPGRIVWYRAEEDEHHLKCGYEPALAAVVTGIISDEVVNLSVYGFDGTGPYARQNIVLVQQGEPAPGQCCWMPYQKGQAAKTEAVLSMSALPAADVEKLRALMAEPGRLQIIGLDPAALNASQAADAALDQKVQASIVDDPAAEVAKTDAPVAETAKTDAPIGDQTTTAAE
jgi:hypothetical protein